MIIIDRIDGIKLPHKYSKKEIELFSKILPYKNIMFNTDIQPILIYREILGKLLVNTAIDMDTYRKWFKMISGCIEAIVMNNPLRLTEEFDKLIYLI